MKEFKGAGELEIFSEKVIKKGIRSHPTTPLRKASDNNKNEFQI